MSNQRGPTGHQRPSYTAEELLQELFGEGRLGEGRPSEHASDGENSHANAAAKAALGLYPVADGRLALIHGAQLAEFAPLSGGARRALHCDLCHCTRSPHEAQIYRVVVADRRARYVTLCLNTASCQNRAGRAGLERLAQHIFPVQSGAEMF